MRRLVRPSGVRGVHVGHEPAEAPDEPVEPPIATGYFIATVKIPVYEGDVTVPEAWPLVEFRVLALVGEAQTQRVCEVLEVSPDPDPDS